MLNQIPVVLAILGLIVGLIVLASIFSKPITTLIQRHFPNAAFSVDNLLLWLGMVVAVFAFGLMLIYLVLYP